MQPSIGILLAPSYELNLMYEYSGVLQRAVSVSSGIGISLTRYIGRELPSSG